MGKTKLFCIPYAGGYSGIYNRCFKEIDNTIQLYPVELSGRGSKVKEPFYDNIENAADDILKTVMKEVNEDTEYAIYGHSMGSLIAFELYYKIKEHKIKKPKHIFFGACKPPNIREEKTYYYKLPRDEFKNMLLKYGYASQSIFEDEKLEEYFLPILRSDMRLCEDYTYKKKIKKIDCDVTIIGGNKDESVNLSELSQWKYLVDKDINLIALEGGHFFIYDQVEKLNNIINDMLA